MPCPCHFKVLYSAQASKHPCWAWLLLRETTHALCFAILHELQSVPENQTGPTQRYSGEFSSFSPRSPRMVLEGIQPLKLWFAPVGTRQSHRLPGDTRGQHTLISLLDQGSRSSIEDGSQLKSMYPFLRLHKISSPFLIFSSCWLGAKLSLALKSLWTRASLGGIRGAPGSRGEQGSRSRAGQGTLQDQNFRNPIHWTNAVADTMLGTHVKIEMLLKMFNLVRQISKNLCKTI